MDAGPQGEEKSDIFGYLIVSYKKQSGGLVNPGQHIFVHKCHKGDPVRAAYRHGTTIFFATL